MSTYAKVLSWLGEKEAYIIETQRRREETEYKNKIFQLLEEKSVLIDIQAKNVEDIAGIKLELIKVNEKLTEVLEQNKMFTKEIQFVKRENRDLTFIIESFLDKYPDARLSEMVRRKNAHDKDN